MGMRRVGPRSEGERGAATAAWWMGKQSVECRKKLREEEGGRGSRDDKVKGLTGGACEAKKVPSDPSVTRRRLVVVGKAQRCVLSDGNRTVYVIFDVVDTLPARRAVHN